MNAPGKGEAEAIRLREGYVQVPMALLLEIAQDRLSTTAFAVYGFLRFWQGPNKDCFPSIPTIVRKTGYSESTVKRAISELLAAGHIARKESIGSTHTKCLTSVEKGVVYVRGKSVKEAEVVAKAPENFIVETLLESARAEDDDLETQCGFSTVIEEPNPDWDIPDDVPRMLDFSTERAIEKYEREGGNTPDWDFPEDTPRMLDFGLKRRIEEYEAESVKTRELNDLEEEELERMLFPPKDRSSRPIEDDQRLF